MSFNILTTEKELSVEEANILRNSPTPKFLYVILGERELGIPLNNLSYGDIVQLFHGIARATERYIKDLENGLV